MLFHQIKQNQIKILKRTSSQANPTVFQLAETALRKVVSIAKLASDTLINVNLIIRAVSFRY
jgi:hypothetical protein